MSVRRATAKRPDLRFDIANYSSESIGKNSKACAPVCGQIATNRITNSRCGWDQSQNAVQSTESCTILARIRENHVPFVTCDVSFAQSRLPSPPSWLAH